MTNNYNFTYKFLEINSQDKLNGSNSNFTINLPYSIPIKKIELLNAQIPNTFFNITDDNNSLTINGVTKKMTNGSYNFTEFRNYFLNSFTEFIDINYYDTLQRVILTSSSTITLSFPSYGSLNTILGFTHDYVANDSSFNSSSAMILQDNFVHINISEFGNNILNANNNLISSTFSIPLTVNKGEYIIFNSKTNYKQFINCFHNIQPIFNLNLRLTNIYGHELINSAPWSILLLIAF